MDQAIQSGEEWEAAKMQGRRLPNNMPHEPQPGDYWKTADGSWQAMTPNGLSVNLIAHDVIEHADGLITVATPIAVKEMRSDKLERLQWRGYLETGIWREA